MEADKEEEEEEEEGVEEEPLLRFFSRPAKAALTGIKIHGTRSNSLSFT